MHGILLAAALVAAANPPSGGAPDLTVLIVESTARPEASARVMRHEVTHLWARYGVDVRWASRMPAGGAQLDLIVVLDETRDPGAALGQVTRVRGAFIRRILVSIPAIRHLVEASAVNRSHPAWDDVYGRLAARVVCHELGHLLLNSAGHDDTGLMRAKFGVRDVLASSAELVDLTPDEAARIRSLKANR